MRLGGTATTRNWCVSRGHGKTPRTILTGGGMKQFETIVVQIQSTSQYPSMLGI